MSTKTLAKKSNGATSAKSNKSQNVVTNKEGKVTGVTNNEIIENAESQPTDNGIKQPTQVVETKVTPTTNKPKAKSEKKVAASKTASKKASNAKTLSIGGKKIRLAATCYHYYRNWLKEWMRSHGAPSARFQKSPESYDGHITILETEKAKGLKALEQWKKENPETKELFWDVKK